MFNFCMGDEDLAEFIGVLLGDGSIGIYKSYVNGNTKIQYRIKITLNSIKDAEYSLYLSKLFVAIFAQVPKVHKRKNVNAIDLYLLGYEPLHFLLRLGLVLAPKWGRAVIPSYFLRTPLDLFVMRGYMDTDGCICVVNNNGIRYPRIEMKICPSPMQSQFIQILTKYGFEPQINHLEKGKIRIALCGINKLKRWDSLIGFSNKRNITVARSFLDQAAL